MCPSRLHRPPGEFLHLWCCPARMTRDACVRAVLAVKAVSMTGSEGRSGDAQDEDADTVVRARRTHARTRVRTRSARLRGPDGGVVGVAVVL